MALSSLRRLADLWLGTDPAQRVRLRHTTLALALMALCVPFIHGAVIIGGGERGLFLWIWSAASLGGVLLFYVAIRCGWTLRARDPSLTTLQIAFALSSCALGYAQAGPLRGAVFSVLTLILLFGMFQLRARNAYALCLLALLLFGTAMAVMAVRRPDVYRPVVEAGHFILLACMLPAFAMVMARLSQVRRRLAEQRAELARALGQLQAIATRDELTGLPNRRQMLALLDQELQRAQRHGHMFCVAIADLDHFKRINDKHGHAVGDTVLHAFAQAGQAAMRGTDVIARWGGEEFIVLMPDTALPPALAGMERLRQQTEALRVAVGEGRHVSVTVSIGITEHRPGEPLTQTLERADRLLYQAKAEGRNRTCMG